MKSQCDGTRAHIDDCSLAGHATLCQCWSLSGATDQKSTRGPLGCKELLPVLIKGISQISILLISCHEGNKPALQPPL